MATTFIESQGVQLAVGDGSSPENYTLIPQITTMSGPGGSASVIDVTTLDSTAREKAMGLPDEGQLSFEMVYNPNNTVQDGLRVKRAARTLHNFELTLTDSPATVFLFSAYVLEFTQGYAVDEVAMVSVTLEISGPVTKQ